MPGDLTVRHFDGTTSVVFVRRVPRELIPDYLQAHMRRAEVKECMLYVVGKSSAWFESLDDDSFDELVTLGQSINRQGLELYLRRVFNRPIDVRKFSGSNAGMQTLLDPPAANQN